MTYLDRAKKLVSSGAVALLPLAVAVTAEAANLTLEAPTSVTQSIAFGSSGGSNLGITGGGIPLPRANGIQGLRLFADATWQFESFGFQESGAAQISWFGQNASGSAAPDFPLIPVEWEFYVGGPTPTLFTGYTLEMFFRDGISESTVFAVAKTFDTPKDDFEETGQTAFTTAFNPTSYEVRLTVFFDGPLFATGIQQIAISVPEIDINNVSTAPIPEPSTWALFMGGAAIFILARRWQPAARAS